MDEVSSAEIEAAARAVADEFFAMVGGSPPEQIGPKPNAGDRAVATAALRAAAAVRDNGDLTIHLMKRHEVEADRDAALARAEAAEAEVERLEAQVAEATATALRATALVERYGEAIIKIQAALSEPEPKVFRARAAIALLDESDTPAPDDSPDAVLRERDAEKWAEGWFSRAGFDPSDWDEPNPPNPYRDEQGGRA